MTDLGQTVVHVPSTEQQEGRNSNTIAANN